MAVHVIVKPPLRWHGARRRWAADDNAVQGLTLAVVLVAVSAAVGGAALLIVMTTDLRDHSQERVQSATDARDIPFEVDQAYARFDGGWHLLEYIQLPTGADRLDLRNVTIHFDAGGAPQTYTYDATGGPGTFTATAQRDRDGSFSATSPVMGQGDLVEITLLLDDPSGPATWTQTQDLSNGRQSIDTFHVPRLETSGLLQVDVAG